MPRARKGKRARSQKSKERKQKQIWRKTRTVKSLHC